MAEAKPRDVAAPLPAGSATNDLTAEKGKRRLSRTRRATLLLWVSTLLVIYFTVMIVFVVWLVDNASTANTLIVAFVNNLGICVGFIGAMVNYEYGGQNVAEQTQVAREEAETTRNLEINKPTTGEPK